LGQLNRYLPGLSDFPTRQKLHKLVTCRANWGNTSRVGLRLFHANLCLTLSTSEIAQRLVELCRQGQNETAYRELFADDAIALEPAFAPLPRTEGLEGLLAKHQYFQSSVTEWHGGSVSEPLVAGAHFSVAMTLDASYQDGIRSNMEEIAVYTVLDGKITQEQFFYEP